MSMMLAARGTAAWDAAASLASCVYERRFAASVRPDPDRFLISRDEHGDVAACAGLTAACASAPTFSEQYLDEPIEVVLGRHLDRPVDRNKIVEVGSLVGTAPRAGAELVTLVPVVVWFLGFEIILCTVTLALEAQLADADINFTPLAPARVSRLPATERRRWGSYYDCGPRVGFIRLDAVERLFSSLTGRYCLLDICSGPESRAA